MTVKIIKPLKYTEAAMQSALAVFFDYRVHDVFPRVHVWDWEADLVVLTKASMMWEVEIKTSMVDWKADIEKSKWKSRHWKNISRFYYAVAEPLLSPKIISGASTDWWKAPPKPVVEYSIPEFVPEFAGVLCLKISDNRIWTTQIRPPQVLSKNKIGPNTQHRLLRSAYYRFWQTGKHWPEDLACADCQDPEILQSIAQEE